MQNPSSPPIILASSSKYRRGLLDRFLSEYQTVSPGVDEAAETFPTAEETARQLARKKAEKVSSGARSAIIIGADQVAAMDDRILGKPGDHTHAVEQLLSASGRSMTFLTAVCVLDPVGRRRYEHVDRTEVQFRTFDRRLVETYLRHDEPYDCAGSFKIEGAGFVLFKSVRTDDPTALIGLPMIWLAATLRELGCLLP